MRNPTVRSLAMLRGRGYLCRVVEHWNPHAKVRVDLWGCDILAIKIGEPPLLVQTTTQSNQSARIEKLRMLPSTTFLLRAGWELVVHGWKTRGCDETKLTWRP